MELRCRNVVEKRITLWRDDNTIQAYIQYYNLENFWSGDHSASNEPLNF
jgi:hypothetical protein